MVGTVRSWEQGRSKPRHEVLAQIAELTGKPISWFYGDEEPDMTDEIRRLRERLEQMEKGPAVADHSTLTPDLSIAEDFTLLPLLGTVTAGPGGIPDENIEEYHYIPRTFIPDRHTNCCFLIRVTGESMVDAGIQEGDLLLVCNSVEVESGDVAVVEVDGEAMCKRVRWVRDEYGRNRRLILLSDNPDFEPIEVDQVRVVGRVMKSIRDL